MGFSLKGLVNTAVGVSPYALAAIHGQQARDEADQDRALRQLYQVNADRRAELASQLQQQVGQANIDKIGAQTTKLQQPIPAAVKYQTDDQGNVVGLPTKLAPGQDITPMQTGVKTQLKPLPPMKIDPNSPQGIAAAGEKAGVIAKAKAPYATPKNPPLVKTMNPDGSVTYTPAPQAVGMAAPVAGGAGALSGQTMQTLGRLGMSFNDLKQAIDQMDRYENTPGNLAKQTAMKQALGAASEAHPSQEAHGLMGALNNAAGAFVGAKAQEKIGKDDPEYRTYLNNKQRVATAFTELLPRPNQQLLQLEKGLSGADVGWNPDLIKNIQARRRGGLDVLKNILAQQGMVNDQGEMTGAKPGRGGGRGGSPPPNVPHPPNKNDVPGDINLGAPTREQQLWDAAVAKHGKEKVLAEYGPRPE